MFRTRGSRADKKRSLVLDHHLNSPLSEKVRTGESSCKSLVGSKEGLLTRL